MLLVAALFALLSRLGSRQLELQCECHISGGRVTLDKQIEVAIGDPQERPWPGSGERGGQQDRGKLDPLPFMRECVGVGHPVAAQ